MKTISLSTVTPVYSGASYLSRLIEELNKLREKWLTSNAPISLEEAIFVDDSAIDNSPQILDEISLKYSWVTVIHLSRNFGQHSATVAGILHSSGDWIVTLDEDLQHHPDQIEHFLKRVSTQSCDVVYAHPQENVHESLIRDISSSLYKMLIAKLAGDKNILLFNSFRLIRGSIGRAASSVCSHDMYFDIVLSWFTERVCTIHILLKDERLIGGGKSGYTLRKLLSHARRMIISTHTKALRIGALIGLGGVLTSIFYGGYVIFIKTLTPDSLIHGLASSLITTLFFGGIIVSLISVLLEYISVILLHAQGKPTFFVVDRRDDKILAKYFQDDS